MGGKIVFKSDAGRDKVRTYYNQILSMFPFSQRYIDTSFGKTFLLEAGKLDAQDLILLHGSCSNSAFWFSEIMTLSQYYHVYAVDIIGEAGNSDENRLDTSSNEYALWLKELFDVLMLKKVILVGNSLGGWMALNFSIEFPCKVDELILIATSGITPPLQLFLEKSESILNSTDCCESLNSSVIGKSEIPKEVSDFINLIMDNFNPIMGALPIYTDDQLKKLDMPVLLIIGEDDVTVNANDTAQRLTKLVPRSDVHVLNNCGHVVINSVDIILNFLLNKI